MPSTYSSLLRLELMATGEKSATWGDITNTNLGTLIEKSIAGTASINVTAGNVTMTALNGTDDESRCAIINITGTPGVSRNVVAPSASKTYCVINGSNAAVVFKGAATTGVTLSSGQRAWLAWNGSDFVTIGVPFDSPSFTGTTSVATLTASGTGTVGTGVTPGTYVFRAVSTTGDRLRILSATSTNGVNIEVTDAGETTTARPLTLGATNTTVNLGAASQFTKDASGNVGIGVTPATRLHVKDSSVGAELRLETSGTFGTTGTAFLRFADTGGTSSYIGFGGTSGAFDVVQTRNASMRFYTNNTLWMTLAANGDLSATARAAVGASAPFFSGVPLTVRVGTNQVFGVLTSTISGTAMVNLAGLTDAGSSTNLAISGNSLYLSGNGGSTTHFAISNAGQAAFTSSSALRLVYTAAPTGSNGGLLNFENWNNSSSAVTMAQLYCQTTNGAAGSEAADLLFYTKPTSGALAETFRLKDVGQVFVPRIHNNSSGASGTTPMIASGTYTPTITQGINCSGGTPSVNGTFKWYRVGNVVHLSGWLGSTGAFTAANTYTELILTVPIASNFTAQSDATGLSAFSNSANNSGQGDYVYADTGGDRIIATFYPNTTSGALLFVEATYEVK